MKITIITVGKLKEKYLKDAIAEYTKRLSKSCKLEIIEVADEKTPCLLYTSSSRNGNLCREEARLRLKKKHGERNGLRVEEKSEGRRDVC